MLDFSQFRKKVSKRYTLCAQGTVSVKKKIGYKTKDRVTRTPLKTEGELKCSGMVSSSCSTSDTRLVNPATNPVLSQEWGKDREVFTTRGTFVTLVLYVCFVDRCLSFGTFSFGHCVVCSSSIYGFWLPPFGSFKLFLQKKINLKNRKYCVIFQADMSFRRFH
jgi:hypothetical protein